MASGRTHNDVDLKYSFECERGRVLPDEPLFSVRTEPLRTLPTLPAIGALLFLNELEVPTSVSRSQDATLSAGAFSSRRRVPSKNIEVNESFLRKSNDGARCRPYRPGRAATILSRGCTQSLIWQASPGTQNSLMRAHYLDLEVFHHLLEEGLKESRSDWLLERPAG